MLTLSPFNDFGLTIRKFSIVSLLTIFYQSRYSILRRVSANICLLLSLSIYYINLYATRQNILKWPRRKNKKKDGWIMWGVTLRRSSSAVHDRLVFIYRLWRYDEMGLSVVVRAGLIQHRSRVHTLILGSPKPLNAVMHENVVNLWTNRVYL